MRQFIFIILLFFTGNFFSQESLYKQITDRLKKDHPEINFNNKLIAVNVWSVKDSKSREANIELDKTINVYSHSKLRGGVRGVIGVLICKDEDGSIEAITLNKDKILKSVSIQNLNESGSLEFSNVIYDSNGNVVNKNISAENIYASIQELITR